MLRFCECLLHIADMSSAISLACSLTLS